ncbi:MAG: hypothetical protein ACI4A5_00180 [Hominilimicola sp.]
MINMKVKNKKITMAVGMAVGVTILAGAVFAGYNTSNGYEVGKTALKGLMKNENYTTNMEFKMSVDGVEIAKNNMTELYDRNGDVKLNRTESSTSDTTYIDNNTEYKAYTQDGMYISSIYYSDGESHTTVYKGETGRGKGAFDEFYSTDEEEKNTTNKVVRFVELAADTFVGDLKNNIVYVSGDDDSSTYEINLDVVQIPELVNAGLSAMFSSMNQYDNEDPYMVLGIDPIVKNFSMKFTVDKEGRLTDGEANITMSGNDHEAAVDIALKMSDYGTTQPQRVDISTLENVETYEMTDEGYITQYKVDTDGSAFDIEIEE